jgi:hypothetical protein
MVPALLQLIGKKYPMTRVEFHSLVPEARREALLKGKVDLLLMVPSIEQVGISYRALVAETLMAALPAREPYLSMDSISVYDFAKETLLLPSVSDCTACHRNNLLVMSKFGLRPATLEAPIDQNSRMAMIAGGSVVGFVGDSARNSRFPGVVLLPFQEEIYSHQLGLAWRTDDVSSSTQAIINAIQAINIRSHVTQRHEPKAISVPALEARIQA